ncbi:MAG TPA: hypothetical protein VKP64_12630 [Mycobacteriales bacterium]|nr:hypothetical protein [Mycobacteriales bacterium]
MPPSEVPRRGALRMTGAVLGGVLLGAGAVFAANALGAERTDPVASAGAAPDASGGAFSPLAICRSLVPAADRAFTHAAAMAQSLAEYDDKAGAAGQPSGEGARGPGSTALVRGAEQSALFNAAYAGYANEVRMSCGSRVTRTTPSPSPSAAGCRDNAGEFVRSVRTWVDHDGDELGAVRDPALVHLGRVARQHPTVLETTKLYPFQRDRFVVAANKWLCPGQP